MRSSANYGDGIPFVVWSVMWLLGGVVAVVCYAYDFLWPSLDRIVGRDFSNLWTAGKLVWSGQAECAFDPNCFRIAELDYLNLLSLQNYSYPPPALFVAAPFALLPYGIALILWTIVGVTFFVLCARSYLPKGFPPLLAALTPAGTINIWNGHYAFLIGGLWLLFFRDLETRASRSGLFAGLLTLKPHLGLMIAATALRKRRAVIAAVLTTAALFVMSAVAFGPGPWNWFIFGTTSAQQEILSRSAGDFYLRMMPCSYVAFGQGKTGLVAQIISGLTAIGLLIRYRRWDTFSAATATFLIVPYSFNYDMTVACLGFALALYGRWSSMTLASRAVLFVAFLSPELTYFTAFLVPPVLLAALNIQLRTLGEIGVSLNLDSAAPAGTSENGYSADLVAT